MPSETEDEEYYNKHQEEDLDYMVEQAVEAAAKGENIEQLLDVMLASVTGARKDKLRKKFSAALKQRNMRTPSGDGDVPSRKTLARLRDVLAVTARQAYERVAALMRARPDLAERIQEAGNALAANGVTVERIQIINEADLGTIAPTAVGKSQTRGDGRIV